jgi:predicted GNAT family acetyltransferase
MPSPVALRPLKSEDFEAFRALCKRNPTRLQSVRINIEALGFQSSQMRSWGAFASSESHLCGVLLRFINTLIAVDAEGECAPLFAQCCDAEAGLSGLRGSQETIAAIQPLLRKYAYANQEASLFMQLYAAPQCTPESMRRVRCATPRDLDRLAALYANAGVMYRTRANIAAKLHAERVCIVEEPATPLRSSRIVSCALMNAECADAGLIGGVFTLPEARGRGYAAACTAVLSRELQRDGKQPCLFYENPTAGRIYARLGFQTCDRWTLAYLAPRYAKA